MRRVYYAYAIRLVTNPSVVYGFLMLGTMIALTYFVSLGNVLHNLSEAPVRYVGVFFYNAIANTEAWTLLLIGIFIYALFAFRFRVARVQPLAYVEV